MRVTGDCLPDARLRFAADFRGAFERATTFVALFRFGPRAVFDAVLARLLDARLDAAVVLRPAFFLPDDFDAVAMICFLGGRYAHVLRKIRAQDVRRSAR